MIKTYYVTRGAGQVRRLDDLTAPWVDVSVAHTDGFLDVMTEPDDPSKVIVVGRDNGIFWSADAGATWTQALGNHATGLGTEYPEIWIVDGTTSYIAGQTGAQVFKSTDAGITYNILTAHPTVSGSADDAASADAIHFIDASIGVVGISIGGKSEVWKTTDGGTTWAQLNGAVRIGLSSISGVHISADQQVIVAQLRDGIYRSTDAGVTFVQVVDLTPDVAGGSGLHLTWIDDNTMWVSGIGDTLRKSTDAGATWTVIRAYSATSGSIIGAHFYDALNGFVGQPNTIHTTDDAGATITLSETQLTPNAIWTGSAVIATEPCYILTDCEGLADPIYTGTDLSGNVDQVITLADTDGSELSGCWFVSLNFGPCNNAQDVTVYQCYTECSDCVPAPPPIRKAKPRVVLPNYSTGTCDPALVEKAFCSHAQMRYRKTLERRFKLKNCCPKDELAIEMEFFKIRHKLLERENPTPDDCNPLCVSYGATLQPGFSAVTTYTDCDGVEQTITQIVSVNVQVTSFCALNTNPPEMVVTDDQGVSVTYILMPIGDCECVGYQLDITSVSGGYVEYIDCSGLIQKTTFIGGKNPINISFCGKRDQTLNIVGADTSTITITGPC